ncbi:MAG: hypothetical protein ACPGUV_15000, partial [Polyangiales bacterium]
MDAQTNTTERQQSTGSAGVAAGPRQDGRSTSQRQKPRQGRKGKDKGEKADSLEARLAASRQALVQRLLALPRAARWLLVERGRARERWRGWQRYAHAHRRDTKRFARQARRWLDLSSEVRESLNTGGLSQGRADRLFREASGALDGLRQGLRACLGDMHAPVDWPRYRLPLNINVPRYQAHARYREPLLRLSRRFAEQWPKARRRQLRWRWHKCRTQATHLRTLSRLRKSLLSHLSPGVRELVLGLGPAGVHQVRQELAGLELLTRWYVLARGHDLLTALPRWLTAVLARASSRGLFLQALGAVMLAMLLWRRRQRLYSRIQDAVAERSKDAPAWALLDQWLPVLAALSPSVGFWLLVSFVRGRFQALGSAVEWQVVLEMLWAYSVYKVAVAAVHYFFVSATRYRLHKVSPALSRRIMRTVQVGGRYVFAIHIFLF